MTLQEYEFPVSKIANIGSQMTMLVEKNYYLHRSAKDAYRSYLMSYASHSHKDIFNVHEIDLQGFFLFNITFSRITYIHTYIQAATVCFCDDL